MSKKPMIASLALVTLGLIFGVVLVSAMGNSGGVQSMFAKGTNANVTLGGTPPQIPNGSDLKSINNIFTSVSKAVLPTVVSIHVVDKAESNDNSDDQGDDGNNEPHNFFFKFFGPNGGGGNQLRNMPRQRSIGDASGVIITEDGYILTNNHVVENSSDVKVTIYDHHEYDATVVGTDPSTDIAVIKIDTHGLTAAAFGNSDELEIGEWVEAIGNPLRLSSTVTAGIISAKARPLPDLVASSKALTPISDFIQTDAAINPGNSGGGLFDLNGTLVGINSAIATTNGMYQGYGFAVPINIAKVVAEDLIKHGSVNRGYINASIREVNDALADATHLGSVRGVVVEEAKKGGAGAKAGLETGDIILTAGGMEVNSPSELQGVVAEHHAGDKLVLKIWRDEKEIEIPVVLKPLEEAKTIATSDNEDSAPIPDDEDAVTTAKLQNLGIEVHNLDDKTKSDFDIENGVKVTAVNPYSDAAAQGLAAGDVIVKVDHKAITSSGQLQKIVQEKKTGETITFVAMNKSNKTTTNTFLVAVRLKKQLSDE